MTTFLGVNIDGKLTWKDYIFYICNKLSKNIANVYRARPLFHQCTLRNLYCALMLSYISYCAMV